MLTSRRGSNMAEAAITMPVVLMVLFFALNVSLASYTAVAAANAASYGARLGAVARDNPVDWARAGVIASLRKAHAPGGFAYAVLVDEQVGGAVQVTVFWTYPSMLSGICNFFGGGCPANFSGNTTSIWKKEGW
jgi:Flp pilus assembly protein TadG